MVKPSIFIRYAQVNTVTDLIKKYVNKNESICYPLLDQKEAGTALTFLINNVIVLSIKGSLSLQNQNQHFCVYNIHNKQGNKP